MRETNDPGIQSAVNYVARRLPVTPEIALILGSGLAGLAEQVENATVIATSDIPEYPRSTVSGHPGRLVAGTLAGVPVIVMQGRVHYYEGCSMGEVAAPTRLAAALGVSALVITNASGALSDRLKPGDLMRISDHINLMGDSPLIGQRWGFDQFPDMSEAYDRRLGEILHEVARTEGVTLKQGVHVAAHGPSYETPAEVRYMRQIGGDAVSMSTAPEAIAAARLKLPVAGISYISNYASGISGNPLSHEEVTAMGAKVGGRFSRLLRAAIPAFARELSGRGGA
ncbi:MAG: Purine nucleoside phosphorylase 1 [Calditrichaeota bacterium]|nr:Purine nucleoside phosphorylase 1 [Calditrichota bacterium]